MERLIGELKWELNADHWPCNTLAPNAIFAGIMLLSFNLLYHLQELMSQSGISRRKSVRSFRRYLRHLPAYVVCHARQRAVKIILESLGAPATLGMFLACLLKPLFAMLFDIQRLRGC